MIFELNSNTNVIFNVDSGSEISVKPKEFTNAVNKYLPHSREIQGFGNKTIHPIGSVAVKLRLGKFVLGDEGAKML